MALLRRRHKGDDVPRAGPYAPGWDVPARFNFTRDVVESLAKDPVRSALTFVDREGIVDRQTFADLSQDAARWAHLLRTRLERGDRVLLAVGKVPAWVGAMLGALKSGVVAVPCPDDLRARDLAFRVRHSGARLVIADRSLETEIEEMGHQIPSSVSVLYLDEALAEVRRYLPVAPTEETTAGETALLLYTSGTTKDPKAAVHTHAYTWAARAQATHWLDAHEGDVVWCTAGTGSAKAIWNVLLGPWSTGAEVVLHEGAFEPEERLSLLQRLGVTVLCQSPTEYRMLGRLETLEAAYLPRLRHGVSSGEPLNPEVIARFQDALGLTIHDGYGQTETSLLVANTPGSPLRPGSMGTPTPGHDVTVIDGSGHVCAPGVEGDLAVIGRPPTLFTGYWDAPEETAAVFRDGWYVTGDRAHRDEEGYLWFVGRADDVILSSAYRIGPAEVESALLEHPAVAESAVVGIPDVDRGQIVKAFVVLRPGHEAGERLATELQEHVKAVTAPYKYPRALSFVEELPKTPTGKVMRSELRRLNDEIPQVVAVDGTDPVEAEPARPEPLRLVVPDAAALATREAEEALRAKAAAEEGARRTAEALERARAQAEARARAETEASERARREAEDPMPAEAEAEAEAAGRSGVDAEEADAARIEAEEQARIEAEAAARREAEERARAEAEERARAEAEEQARLEAEEQARIEAEAAARREVEEAERARAAAAAEAARLEAEEQERIAAEAQARIEAEALVEHAGADGPLDAEDEAELEPAHGESWAEARRRRKAEKAAAKQRAEDERRRAKEEEEQRKRDEIAAREEAKRREAEEKIAAKQRAEDEKLAAKQRAEEERLREEEERLREEEERRRQREEAKARRKGGLGRLFQREESADEFDDDEDVPAEPIPGIVERLRYYSGVPSPTPEPDDRDSQVVPEEQPSASRTADPE